MDKSILIPGGNPLFGRHGWQIADNGHVARQFAQVGLQLPVRSKHQPRLCYDDSFLQQHLSQYRRQGLRR